MREVPGFESSFEIVDTLYEGHNFDVFRARAVDGDEPVVLKVAKLRGGDGWTASRLKHEHRILSRIDSVGVVEPKALIDRADASALVLADTGSVSLARLLDEGAVELTTADKLRIALDVARALGDVHAADVIHKDVNPNNIIVHPETLRAQIIDFSISSLLSRERASVSAFDGIEGTLSYIAPEQTGRMNRLVDYRCDYYSLGITLYELFTGRLPFESGDAMALVHSHIAKVPDPPEVHASDVSPRLSAAIMKLLAKMAEDRYQSSYALARDLRVCLAELTGEDAGDDGDDGDGDISSQLQVSQKLYGRDAEVAELLAAFARIRATEAGGHSELVLVAGYSGIGKSSIVNEIHKPIAGGGGYFVDGKFDQFKRNIPYASMIVALRQLVRQVLGETPEALDRWRERLVGALGPNAQVIVEVIPELELIIGEQPPVPALGSSETKNRFNLAFRAFINVFAGSEHPLVLFLDDLQWADNASLELLETLLTDSQIRHMLLIGAYRDNEVDASHPLELLLGKLRAGGEAKMRTITLAPLEAEHVRDFVADTLHCTAEAAEPLAALLLRKTQGNPFFLVQTLHEIYRKGSLSFDPRVGAWRWDIEAIEEIGIADNVVELMLTQLRDFKPATQRVLTTAACIGNEFDLDLLARINDSTPADVAASLWEPLRDDLIQPLSDDYKAVAVGDSSDVLSVQYRFSHDRVQQAAYELSDAAEHEAIHARLGQLLIEHTDPDELDDAIFDITMHLNLGVARLTTAEQRRQARQLNHRAGRRARDSSAYATSLQCLRAAMELLEDDAWASDYDETVGLYRDAIEAEYLNINFEAAERLAEVLLERATDVLDKIPVYDTRIQFYVSENKMQAAIDVAIEVVGLLGITMDEAPPESLASDETLLALPVMTDAKMLAAMRILMAAMPAVYIANPMLLPSIAFTMVRLCVTHGNSPFSAYAFALLGLIQCGFFAKIDEGYRWGKLSLRLLEAYEAKELESKVYALFYIFVIHWKVHVREAVPGLLQGVRSGLESGDIEYAGYNAIHYCTFPLFYGEDLETVDEEMQTYEEMSLKLQQQYQLYYIRMWRQLLLGLRAEGCDGVHLAGSGFDERTMLANLGENRTSKFTLHQSRAMLLYAFGHYEAAIESSRQAREFVDAAAGFVSPVAHNQFYSLSLLAHYAELSEDEQKAALELVDANQVQMDQWAGHAPENNRHKHDLIAAERARATRSALEALSLYESSIAGARRHGYLQDEALAYELMARTLNELGHRELAQQQMTAAYRLYRRWGAAAKADALQEAHPDLVAVSGSARGDLLRTDSTYGATSTGAFAGQALDMVTVVKASQALASEIVLEKLIHNLMRIVVENVGAQDGVLLLDRDGVLTSVAHGTATADAIEVIDAVAPADPERVPMSLVNYVLRTRKSVVIHDMAQERVFAQDPYLVASQPKSVVCAPLIHKDKCIGVLYFEHADAVGVFTPARLEVLNLLSAQVAISIENSQLYEQLEDYSRTLEQKVDDRTQELRAKNRDLHESLARIEQMQEEIIEQQKLASLGSVTAGVAHEIRNPLNFVNNFSAISAEMTEELDEELAALKGQIDGEAAESLAEIVGGIRGNLGKVREHSERIEGIISLMLGLTRDSGGVRESVDVNELVTEYVSLGYHGSVAEDAGLEVAIETHLDAGLEPISLVRNALGRVILNLIANACTATEARRRDAGEDYKARIDVTTSAAADHVEIRVRDNGVGVPPEHADKVFEPFFTTNPTGTGHPGLGLSISHEVVVQQHGGSLTMTSMTSETGETGPFTEFVVRLPQAQPKRATMRAP